MLCEFLARHQGDPGRPGSPAWFRWRALLAGACRVLFLPPKRVAGADRCRAAAWLRPQHLANLTSSRQTMARALQLLGARGSVVAGSQPSRTFHGRLCALKLNSWLHGTVRTGHGLVFCPLPAARGIRAAYHPRPDAAHIPVCAGNAEELLETRDWVQHAAAFFVRKSPKSSAGHPPERPFSQKPKSFFYMEVDYPEVDFPEQRDCIL